jgi:hypothetical protein
MSLSLLTNQKANVLLETVGSLMSNQTVVRERGWLCGFSQIEGVDFDQIFSLIVRYETVQLICALAALEKWHISTLDVRNAYLYGKLSEEIYMEQSEGYKAPGKEHKVLRLYKALYGLKQAGLTW